MVKKISSEHPFSWAALTRIIIASLAVFLAWKGIGVFVDILIAILIATVIYPFAKKFNKKIPFVVSTSIAFLLLLVPFVLFGIFVVPSVVQQFPDLLNTFHSLANNLNFLPESTRNFDFISYVNQHSDVILSSTTSFALTTFSTITILFMAFYFVIGSEQLFSLFLDIFPEEERVRIKGLLLEIVNVNGKYISGSIIISLFCAVIVFIGLTFFDIPFALPLAIFAGIINLLPLIGPLIGGIPAIIIAFTIMPWKGVVVLCAYIIYQQIQNVIISPLVYKKALHISPTLSFVAVVIGGGLFGILGAFLALPIAASIPSIISYAKEYKQRND